MSEELFKILSNSNKDIDNQKLMDYISNKGNETDRFEIEANIADSDFLFDALEGLNTIKDSTKVAQLTDAINNDFKKQLIKKKGKRLKKSIMPETMIYFTIALILLLVIVGYILIRKHLGY